MKVEVIEKRANQVRNFKCPVCGKEAIVVIEEGRTEGSLHCWFCSSLLGWSIEDEVKEVELGRKIVDELEQEASKPKKKVVKNEKTT